MAIRFYHNVLLTNYQLRLKPCRPSSEFSLPVGFSDHTEGSTAAVVSVALGARMIEKHFTIDKSLPGPDHIMSLDPSELELFIKEIRTAELMERGKK